ncbi:alpha/beta hydrolase [Zhouia sp. PK063]|uniref:alpha/beta hydrolase n=1 Tax=Zhouia sp. PK063 TaxID=3373602 RepID=UPI0037A0C1A7
MKSNIVLLCFFALLSYPLKAQIKQEVITSQRLGEDRSIQIYAPKDIDSKKSYSLIVVLDGDYMFDLVTANVKFFTYKQEMPETIVVGINQNYDNLRTEDVEINPDNGLPANKANAFFDFINVELIPYIEQTYRLSNFKAIVGHQETANFINYTLFKDHPQFNAYISLAPILAPQMEDRLVQRLTNFNEKQFYYLAIGQGDKENDQKLRNLSTQLKNIKRDDFHFYADDFVNIPSFDVAAMAIPKALNAIFDVYKPISAYEYKTQILTSTDPVYNYLENKYQTIQDLFGFKKPVSLNDIMAIYAACRKKEDFESQSKLSDLAKKEFPDTMLGFYLEGEYLEKVGKPKQALRAYQKAYILKNIDFLDKDIIVDRMTKLKQDFGL